jgi:hypothetical protein
MQRAGITHFWRKHHYGGNIYRNAGMTHFWQNHHSGYNITGMIHWWQNHISGSEKYHICTYYKNHDSGNNILKWHSTVRAQLCFFLTKASFRKQYIQEWHIIDKSIIPDTIHTEMTNCWQNRFPKAIILELHVFDIIIYP